ncbi:hypothetical protein HHK36_022052 [Tetracentron sinense]|uniref:FAR1 domain-containing protein n=1 Tax=Tetracentron sinense TaxID=13715 RepID=A0A835D5U7_TETSI|nr:hypothetical protein HHK36_022052 [Tetracentron sinense]
MGLEDDTPYCSVTVVLETPMAVALETPTGEGTGTAEISAGGESGVCDGDGNLEPYEGMVFESEEAARAFYDEYARRLGFVTRIVSSRKSERDGSIISRRLACNKEGFNLNSRKIGRVRIRKRESKREGCMAMILVKREKPGKWIATKFVKEHNHPLLVSSSKGRITLVHLALVPRALNPGFKRLTAKGLCYNCDEKFGSNHKCKAQQFSCIGELFTEGDELNEATDEKNPPDGNLEVVDMQPEAILDHRNVKRRDPP